MTDADFLRLALRLACRGSGTTSPNPMVGAVLVRRGKIIGRGWHRRAGEAHAEIEALRDAQTRGHLSKGATLYVTLEPCCTHGRTPSAQRFEQDKPARQRQRESKPAGNVKREPRAGKQSGCAQTAHEPALVVDVGGE